MIKTEKLVYGSANSSVQFEGSISYEDSFDTPRPGVLVCHAYGGHSDFDIKKSEQLAELGYFAFAMDLYGQGRRGSNPQESMELMNEFNSDRVLLQQRMIHAFETLKNFDKVDENKTGAIGFCFGGKCALDLARAGEDVKGVVSFHGLYDAPTASSGKQLKGSIKIDSSILILHGYDDPMATPQNMIDLADELNSKKANWQIHAYGNVGHAFTNPEANDRNSGLFYDTHADQHSWREMSNFFEKIFS